jgi:pimeloyl-ACP methyl ester carboxylesterase
MLARLLQLITIGALVAAATWFTILWDHYPALSVLGAAFGILGFVPFLCFEFIIARSVNRADPAPQASLQQWIGAWFGEVLSVARVFCWRQPFFWNVIPDQVEDAFGHRGRRGIVFIHGFVCNRGLWTPWLKRMLVDRRAFVAVNLEPLFGSIDAYSAQIEHAISRVTLATGMTPLVVCHSMGGLAIRAWLRSGGEKELRIHHIVTIGSPHHGTWLGRFAIAPNARQMQLNNSWLHQLEASESPAQNQRFTCFYSNCDNIVFPASTAMLPGADNRLVAGVAHVDLAFAPDVMSQTLAKLEKN